MVASRRRAREGAALGLPLAAERQVLGGNLLRLFSRVKKLDATATAVAVVRDGDVDNRPVGHAAAVPGVTIRLLRDRA